MGDGRGGGELTKVAAALRGVVAGFEPDCLDGGGAVAALALFGEIERLAAAGKALAAVRVEATRAWQGRGMRSAAHFVATTFGSSVRSAVEALEAARRLDELPATAEALRSGKLSAAQASEIVSAAGDRPGLEAELVAVAGSETLPALQQRYRAVRAEGAEALAAYEGVRATRYLRHWSDREGALRLEARLCPDDGAKVLAALESERRGVFAAARRDGRREPFEAYDADALVALARRRLMEAEVRGTVRGPWCMSASTTPPWSGATASRVRRATSPGWVPSRWPAPEPWPATASSRGW